MDLFGGSESVDSADSDISSCLSSPSVFPTDQKTEFPWNKISLKQPTVSLSGELRYLTPLWVSSNEEPLNELYRAEKNVLRHHEFMEKIRGALKLLAFREERVLVQFWSPLDVGKHQLLTSIDQPFGLGVIDEGLYSYRRDSERNVFLVDKDHAEEDISPHARVFRRELPEWTPDLHNYLPKHFPQQDTAIHCNLHGYLALPVFDSTTSLCIGVIEILMSSKITDYAFEVQQVHEALKTQSLTSPQVSDFTTPPYAPNEQRLIELDKIFGILKSVCDSHNLPLAQTWAVSPSTSIVAHEKALQGSCSNFNTKCINKDCMSTTSLPFYVGDLRVWPFREASKMQHLDKSRSFVGKALLARGTSYCQDVTELCEEEYPLVHNARMSGLTSCVAVFLHSIAGDADYVLEFFQPLDSKEGRHVNLMQTLKHKVEVASGFELGQKSPTEFFGPSIQISSTTTANSLAFGADPLDSQSILENVGETHNERDDIIIDAEKTKTITDVGAGSHYFKRGRKRKIYPGSIQRTNYKVQATFGRSFIKLRFPTTVEFLILKKEVVRRFNLEGKRLHIKYKDEANDRILITCDVDLALAFETSDKKSINIHCEAD